MAVDALSRAVVDGSGADVETAIHHARELRRRAADLGWPGRRGVAAELIDDLLDVFEFFCGAQTEFDEGADAEAGGQSGGGETDQDDPGAGSDPLEAGSGIAVDPPRDIRPTAENRAVVLAAIPKATELVIETWAILEQAGPLNNNQLAKAMGLKGVAGGLRQRIARLREAKLIEITPGPSNSLICHARNPALPPT